MENRAAFQCLTEECNNHSKSVEVLFNWGLFVTQSKKGTKGMNAYDQ